MEPNGDGAPQEPGSKSIIGASSTGLADLDPNTAYGVTPPPQISGLSKLLVSFQVNVSAYTVVAVSPDTKVTNKQRLAFQQDILQDGY